GPGVAPLGDGPHDDVAVGEHAGEPVVVADRQRPDVQHLHLAGGVLESAVGRDALDARGHHLFHSHGRPPRATRLHEPPCERCARAAGRGGVTVLLSRNGTGWPGMGSGGSPGGTPGSEGGAGSGSLGGAGGTGSGTGSGACCSTRARREPATRITAGTV